MTAPATVSCVIPVRNEARAIAAAVESCLRQDHPGPLEVVVADGMSDDGTREAVAGLAAADPRVRLVDNPARVTPGALNAAITASSGEVVVRCDAHAVLPPGYVSTAVRLLDKTGAACVGGVQKAVGITTVQRAIAAAMSTPVGVGDARFHYGGDPGPVDTVYLGVFRRDALAAVGGFDEDLRRNQDYELNHRLRLAHGPDAVWFDPALAVEYRPRASLGALWRQYFDYGVGKRAMLRRHPRSLRWRQLVAPAFVVAMAASAVALALGWTTLGLVVPVAYAAVLVLGTAVEAARRRDVAMLALPAALATMHTAWGLGFLAESLRRR